MKGLCKPMLCERRRESWRFASVMIGVMGLVYISVEGIAIFISA